VMHWMSLQTLVWPAWVQVQVWHKTVSYHMHIVLELQHHSKCETVASTVKKFTKLLVRYQAHQ
jgi:hypothetical protein